jgi:hypothetical protein
MRFVEGKSGGRLVKVEDTPFASDAHQLVSFGAAGLTFPAAAVSSVRVDVLFNDGQQPPQRGRATAPLVRLNKQHALS